METTQLEKRITQGLPFCTLKMFERRYKPIITLEVRKILVEKEFEGAPPQELPEWHGTIELHLPKGRKQFNIKIGHCGFHEDLLVSFGRAISNDFILSADSITGEGFQFIAEKLALETKETHSNTEPDGLIEIHQICFDCFADHLRKKGFLKEAAIAS